jgi:hypothetical protein
MPHRGCDQLSFMCLQFLTFVSALACSSVRVKTTRSFVLTNVELKAHGGTSSFRGPHPMHQRHHLLR